MISELYTKLTPMENEDCLGVLTLESILRYMIKS